MLFREWMDTIRRSRTPWIIFVYTGLVLLFSGLLVFGTLNSPTPKNAEELELFAKLPPAQLFTVAAEMLKVVVGAMLGSLSMAATAQWGTVRKENGKGVPSSEPQAGGGGGGD